MLLVGNPWPGRTRVELGDELAIVVGVLAVLAWILWARFLLAVVAEVRRQLEERARLATVPGGAPERVRFEPPPAPAGAGRLAQQLVAAVLVLLPVVGRVAPSPAAGLGPVPAARPAVAAPADRPARPPAPAPAPIGAARFVVVAPGDTLIGIARAELGDADRWREIFEANRETVQPDGGRLTSPSLIRAGWTLVLPAAPPMPAAVPVVEVGASPATVVVTIAAGDTLWDLTRDHLAAAGLAHDDRAVADHLPDVVADNADVVADPDLIVAGQQLRFRVPDAPEGAAPAAVGAPASWPGRVRRGGTRRTRSRRADERTAVGSGAGADHGGRRADDVIARLLDDRRGRVGGAVAGPAAFRRIAVARRSGADRHR